VAPVYRFTFDSPERALQFVRQVFMQCFDVVTFRDECTVRVMDGHTPRQLDKLLALANDLGSIPPALPYMPTRAPTRPEDMIDDIDIEWDDDKES
jgi:hypothetical protein